MFIIEEELKSLPDGPGVYIMKDSNTNIIYVGKAISLKKRVRQYFNLPPNSPAKVATMVAHILSFEYIVTDNELEALVLECNLIKQHKPRYNVLLKDDKNYPYVKVTTNEDYPRVFITRRVVKDGAKYFGPYTNVTAINDTMNTIKNIFPIRTCSKIFSGTKKLRPCLNYHIGRCCGPCTGEVSKEQYREYIDDVINLLSGRYNKIEEKLTKKMKEYSNNLNFEKAAVYRDKINSIAIITRKQKVLLNDDSDRDVVGYAFSDDNACIEVFFVRGGKLLGRQNFFFENCMETPHETIGSFLKQFYIEAAVIPPEILVMTDVPERQLIEDLLYTTRGKKVVILVPQKGDKSELVKMVSSNAQISLRNKLEGLKIEKDKADESLMALSKLLNLHEVPCKIEAFDISNTGSDDIVAGMVVFKDGVPFKDGYRRYKIKSIDVQDDYASMREVLTRRLRRIKDSGLDMPDMLLVDGGMSHVVLAEEVLSTMGMQISVFGMARDDKHRTRALVSSNFEYDILSNMPVLRLIVEIQDEVHRYALTYNRISRKNRYQRSVLDSISGVGPKRKKALVQHFGSIEKIKNASLEELIKIEGIDRKTAQIIWDYFNIFSSN